MGGDVTIFSPKCKKERRGKPRCSFKYTKFFQPAGRRCAALTFIRYHSLAGLSSPLVQRLPLAAGALVNDRSDLTDHSHDINP